MSGIFVVIAYLGAAIILAAALVRQSSTARPVAAALALAGLIAHAGFLWQTMAVPAGWDVNFFNSLSLISWLIIAVLMLAALRWPVLEIGVLAFPGAALWVIVQLAAGPAPVVLQQPTVMIELHVASSLLAYAILSIAALNALVIFVQDRMLHRHSPARLLEALPPLTVMERVLFYLIATGWAVLTVSLITGFVFVENLLAQHLVHKTVLSVAAWLVFGLLLIGRRAWGWRGRTAVGLTLLGMLVLLLAYFGSKLVLELILDRTWIQSS